MTGFPRTTSTKRRTKTALLRKPPIATNGPRSVKSNGRTTNISSVRTPTNSRIMAGGTDPKATIREVITD